MGQSASATVPYPCGEYPVALLDLPATVKKELVAYRVARDSKEHVASLKAIDRAFAAADAAGCRQSLHFAAALVEGSECIKHVAGDVKGPLQYCTEALALLQAAPYLPPILRSVHSRVLLCLGNLLGLTGRHTEAIVDAQQAAALAVTPWDKVHAYSQLVPLYGHMMDGQGLPLQYEAAAQLEAAVASCEAAGVPSTDNVLVDGTETVWKVKYGRAYGEQDYASALSYVRKVRALAKQEGYPKNHNPTHMLGIEADILVRLGRVEEAMALLVTAARWFEDASVEGGIFLLGNISPCVTACVLMGQSALAHSFLRTAEDIVQRARGRPQSREPATSS